MKKITNIVTTPTKYTEDINWSGVISYKIRLLQFSDWIVQIGSGILRQHKWLQWRESLRKCTRMSFETPEQMQKMIEEIDASMPEVQRYTVLDTSNLNHYKDNIIKIVRYYYSKKLDIELSSYVNNSILIDERYKEALHYKKTKNIQECIFIQSYMGITGQKVDDVVQYFLQQKEMYFLILLRSQKEMETIIKDIQDSSDVEHLKKLYEDYNIWISTLTLTPVQI